MQWHKEVLRGIRDNAVYEMGRYTFLLIAPFVLAPIYTVLSRLGAWNWNWRIHAGLIFIAIIILCFTAWKLIRQRPTATKERLSKLSHHLDEEIEKGAGGIERLEQRRQKQEPTFDPNNAFEIDALAVSDLQNRTEQGADLLGTPGWCLDCVISVHNLHPTQGLGDVTFRIIGLTPPMVAEPAHHPRTQDTTLRRVQFGFTDLPARNALAGDQTGHIRIFQAVKHLLFSEAIKEPPGKTTKTVLVFDGVWPNSLDKEFAPSGEYLLAVELTGSGVGRKEEHFALSFPLEVNKSVFRIHRVDPKCKQAIRCFQETAALLNSINIPSFHAFWRSGAGQLPSSESIAEACRLLVKNSHEDPFAGLEEYLPARDYYAFFDFLKHDASNAGVDPGEGIAYLEAAERWHDKQRYSKPSSDARLRMTFRKVGTY